MKQCVLAFFFGLLVLATQTASAQETTEQEGKDQGSFQSMSIQGLADVMKASQGKVVLINFFASWCEPCKEELAGLVRLRNRYDEKDVVFVGLSLDHEPEALSAYLKTDPLNYPVYTAEEELAYMYNVRAIPHNVVYGRNGELIGNQPGFISEHDMGMILDALVEVK